MLIESPYASSYSMAIVMLALFVTILEIFTVEIYTTLTLTFRIGQDQIKNMLIDSSHFISYLMSIVIFSPSVTILVIFTVQMYITLILTYRTVKVKSSEYANRKPLCNFTFDGNCIVGPICHHFRDIHSQSIP